MPLAALGALGIAGTLGGAAISSNAASNAASTQAQAANNAAQLQYDMSQQALNFEKQQYGTQQNELAPWLNTGQGALANLAYLAGVNPSAAQFGQYGTALPAGQGTSVGAAGTPPGSVRPTGGPALPTRPTSNALHANAQVAMNPGGPAMPNGAASDGIQNFGAAQGGPQTIPTGAGQPANTQLGGFGSLLSGYPGGQFSAPTGLTEANDPGYQARLALGQQMLENSAAARGNILTGGTAQAENQYAQDYASNEYNNVYNRALQNYNTNYNVWANNQANEYNRLASLAGVGQSAANQLGAFGNAAANNVSSNLLNTGANIGQQYNNAAAANASGIVGSANAWGNAIGGATGGLNNLILLNSLFGGGANSGAGSGGAWNELGMVNGG